MLYQWICLHMYREGHSALAYRVLSCVIIPVINWKHYSNTVTVASLRLILKKTAFFFLITAKSLPYTNVPESCLINKGVVCLIWKSAQISVIITSGSFHWVFPKSLLSETKAWVNKEQLLQESGAWYGQFCTKRTLKLTQARMTFDVWTKNTFEQIGSIF